MRKTGVFTFSSNFEPLIQAPLDARQVVDNYLDLINPNTWKDAEGKIWLYKGIVVYVQHDTDYLKRGLYVLTSLTYTLVSSWKRISDPPGTGSTTFQINMDASGVILRDNNGTLVVENHLGLGNISVNHIDASSLKLGTGSGVLVSTDGSINAVPGSYPLKAFLGVISGDASTKTFTINHNLNTLNHTITMYEQSSNYEIFPGRIRGLNQDTIDFVDAPSTGSDYDIIILGF